MLDGLAHGRPLVNGDSGFIPRAFDRAMELFEHGLGAEGLRFLRAVDVRDVVLPAGADAPADGVREAQRLELERVLEVADGPRAAVVAPATPVATRFGRDAITLELPEARRVGRIAFALDDRAWLERPSVLATADGASWEPLDAVASLADATLSLYADPRNGHGEIRFEPRSARAFRIDARLPARLAPLEVGE
jgi:hypothetical protein